MERGVKPITAKRTIGLLDVCRPSLSFFNLSPFFTKSCQDAPLLAVGRNGILVRGFGGQIPPTEQLAFFDGQVEAERARSA